MTNIYIVCYSGCKGGKIRGGEKSGRSQVSGSLKDLKGEELIIKWLGSDFPELYLMGSKPFQCSDWGGKNILLVPPQQPPPHSSPNPPVSTSPLQTNLHVNNLWPQVIRFCCQTNPFLIPVADLRAHSADEHFSRLAVGVTVLPGEISLEAWWGVVKGAKVRLDLRQHYICSSGFFQRCFHQSLSMWLKRDFPGSKQVNY